MLDDLTRIKDIGMARQKWLNELGITTYAELAAANPNWIYEQFLNEGKPVPVSLDMIHNWVEEASSLAAEPPTIASSMHATGQLQMAEDGWNEFASFYISYQQKQQVEHSALRTQIVYRTYADHIEANDNQQWEGIEGNNLCQWILAHVDNLVNDNSLLALSTRPDETPGSGNLAKPGEIRIVGIRVYDPIGGLAIASAGELFKGVVNSQQPLTFDFSLQYQASGIQGAIAGNAWDCKLSLYIYEMPGDKLVLKSQEISQRLSESGQTHHFGTIVTHTIPAGLYRIRAVAALTNQTPILGIVDAPLLQVI